MSIWEVVILCMGSYLIGAISASYLIGKWMFGIDIRQHGSGNAGATNTLRVIGIKAGIAVLLFDAFKGVLTVWVAGVMSGHNPYIMTLTGLSAVVGHNWPIYFGFRGGKGIATTIGVVATLGFFPAFCAGVIAIAVLVGTRIVSLASLTFTTLVPISMLAFHRPLPICTSSVLLAVVSYWKHRENIRRLIRGKEVKLFANHPER
jgi:acyl phosphate:glycerol-3-phosphate acyltransferase